MPKLSDEKRQSIEARRKRYHEIESSFKERQYFSLHCRLCNWASNGVTPDEVIAENRKHEATHPELAEMETVLLNSQEMEESFHDHDCVMATCACKCGCDAGPFCTLVFGTLCSTCVLREIRGDSEHGEKSKEGN